MKRILSFGGGVQTTALAILVAQGKVKVDMAIFADTGGERPETYWYLENYSRPLLATVGIELLTVRQTLPSCQPDLYGWLWRLKQIPPIMGRRLCSLKFKAGAIARYLGEEYIALIGFSSDESQRAKRRDDNEFPLIELGLTATDCHRIISEWGWPRPIKSSCFFCPFQTPFEWQWLKNNHPDLFQRTLDLEDRYYEKKPQFRDTFGIYRGLPLHHIAKGKQYEMGLTLERSCWDGSCGH